MNRSSNRPRRDDSSSWGDLILIWVLIVVSIFAVIGSAGYVFNENLRAYALCAEHQQPVCSDAGWFGSMAFSLGGGIVAVILGAFFGLRQYGNRRRGAWIPLLAIVAIFALTILATTYLKIALPL